MWQYHYCVSCSHLSNPWSTKQDFVRKLSDLLRKWRALAKAAGVQHNLQVASKPHKHVALLPLKIVFLILSATRRICLVCLAAKLIILVVIIYMLSNADTLTRWIGTSLPLPVSYSQDGCRHRLYGIQISAKGVV